MRKNFFKKLSFVLALAMIVSVIAPAAGVFAATGLKLNSTNKTLHLSGQPGKNKYNFNIVGEKQKGWKYLWTSSNEDVAEVNAKNGVTVATGIGTAEITVVITDKNGAEVDRLTAKVTVKDNIKTVKIANVPENAIPVGEEYDFNRSFVTLTGVTEKTGKTTSVTRWSVEGDNKDKATIIEDNGKFVASEAGKYTVVARAFQSKAKYNLWKETGDESLVLAEDSAEITVKASIKEVKQFDLTKFTVTFDSDMRNADLKPETAKVYRVINGKEYESGAEKIKGITLDETGKVATVELYTDFAQESEYRFKFNDLSGDFKSAKVALELVTGIEFSDFNVNINGTATDMVNHVIGKNADGVIIYRGTTNNPTADQLKFNSALSFELADNADLSKTWLDPNNKQIYIYNKGYSIGVKAKFEHYYFDENTNKVETITWTDNAVATGVETDGVLLTSSMQFAVAKSEPASWESKWGAGPFRLAADDDGYKFFARYKTLDKPNSWDPYQVANQGELLFDSTNTDKLITQVVDELDSNGNPIKVTYAFPVAAGTVTVLVRDNRSEGKPVVGAFEVTIAESRGIGGVSVENQLVVANNNYYYGTNGQVTKIVVTDTLNEAAESGKLGIGTIQKLYGPDDSLEGKVTATVLGLGDDWWDNGKIGVNVDAREATAGNYQYKIPVSYKGYLWRDAIVNIQVKEGNTEETKVVVRWALDIDKNEFDLKDVKAPQTLDIKVSGYNKNNVKVAELTADQYNLKIEKNGNDIGRTSNDGYTNYDNQNFYFVQESSGSVHGVSGSYLRILDSNVTYVITATVNDAGKDIVKKAKDAVIGRQTFTLKDSSDRKFEMNPVVNAGTVGQMVKDAFKFFLNGSERPDSAIKKVVYVVGSGTKEDLTYEVESGQSILIKEVYVEGNEGNVVLHKYVVNRTLTAK